MPPLTELASLINQNPGIARWAVEITARQAEVKLARARSVPDLTGTVGYRRFNDSDDDALVAGVSIPLSIFDRNQGGILAARLSVASAQEQQRAAELRIGSALASMHTQLADAYSEATALRDQALPPATEAYETIKKAFDRGDLGYLDVLDAERTLIELREQHLDALVAYNTAKIELESLIGQPITQLIDTPAE